MSEIRKRTISLFIIVLIGGSLFNSAFAAEKESSFTSHEALQFLKNGNARFAEDRSELKDIDQARRSELVKGQHPFAIVLTCADSRVAPELIFNQGLGNVFAVRVAGNVSDPVMLGSIEYAVEHLHVPLLVVLGHEHCGAVAAALEGEKPAGNLGALISQIYVGKQLPKEKEAAQAAAEKNNVLHQSELVTRHSDVLKKAVEEKRLNVVPAIYHLDTGKVEWLENK